MHRAIALGCLAGALLACGSAAVAEPEVELDLAEFRFDGHDSFLIDGGVALDNGLVAKLTAGGSVGRRVEEIQAQLLYSREVASDVAVLVGIRHDFRPSPHTSFAVLGLEAEAARGLSTEGFVFVSGDGDVQGELKAVYDHDLAAQLVLQPRITLHLSAGSKRAAGLARGLTDMEVGLRVRYELATSFVPYVGLSHERLLGRTARLARDGDEITRATHLVVGFSSVF